MNRPTEGCTYCGSDEHNTTSCPMRSSTCVCDGGRLPCPCGKRDVIGEVIAEALQCGTGVMLVQHVPQDQIKKPMVSPAVGEHAMLESVPALREAIAQRDARIEELEAHCLMLGQGGAERYWENRWRETDAELARQVGRLEQMEPHFLEVVEYVNTAGFANWGESCHKTLINDHRRLAALKAQPSGVVLPERAIAGNDQAYLYVSGRNHAIDEMARLNSSPVSAGGVDEPMKRGDEVRRLREALEIYAATYNDHWKPGMPILEPISDSALNEGSAVPDGWQPSGIEYDRGIHHNPDAKAWADLFVATFPALADKHDLMLGWFANAMMAMHDFLKAKQPNGEVLDWAVERWHAEVSQRPLINVHRRALDGAWRQVIRKLGGDPVDLCGPDHSTLLAAAPTAKKEG